jgi:hypothetical protein
MAITLNGTTGITTPDIDSTAGFDAADITGTISQSQLAGEAVNESKLQVSNAPVNGYTLTAQSGNTGGLTWAEAASGYWTNLAEVTLGAALVSAIDITLPTGYDVLKLDISFPRVSGSTSRKLQMQMLNSSDSAQSFSYSTIVMESNETDVNASGRFPTTFDLSPNYGKTSGDYVHYKFEFFDTDSTTLATNWLGQGGCYDNATAKGSNMLSSGTSYGGTPASSKVRFKIEGGNFTDTPGYYRLYGHTYS